MKLARIAFMAAALLALAGASPAQQPVAMKIKAPELREVNEWINSKALTLAELKGQVVVVHFWTFG